MAQLSDLIRAMPRPDTDEYFLLMASLASTRGTCGRRRVGCILVDVHNHVISTGYNGVASGRPHCIDVACPGRDLPSGTGLDKCEALHAEENAIIQCTRPNDIYTVYCTASPCIFCTRRLMNTAARRLVFSEIYPHPQAEREWLGLDLPIDERLDRTWTHRPWNPSPSIASTPADRSEPGPSGSMELLLDTVTLPLRAVVLAGSKTRSSPTPQGERWRNSQD